MSTTTKPTSVKKGLDFINPSTKVELQTPR